MKTPRNSSSDFSREKYDEPEIVMAAMNSAANAAANSALSLRSNSVSSFQLLPDQSEHDHASNNSRVSFNLNQQQQQQHQSTTATTTTSTNGHNMNTNSTNSLHGRPVSSRSSSRTSNNRPNRTDSQNSTASNRSIGVFQLQAAETSPMQTTAATTTTPPTSPLFLTQVNLSLSLPKNHRASTSSYAPVWKYNTVRKLATTGRSSENGNT